MKIVARGKRKQSPFSKESVRQAAGKVGLQPKPRRSCLYCKAKGGPGGEEACPLCECETYCRKHDHCFICLQGPKPGFNGKTMPLTVWATDGADTFDVCIDGELRGQIRRYVPEGAKTVAWARRVFPERLFVYSPFLRDRVGCLQMIMQGLTEEKLDRETAGVRLD